MNLKELQKKYNLSDLELFSQDTATHKISFSANKIKQAESTYTSGNSIRLIKDKKIGFSANFGNFDLDTIVSRAVQASVFSPTTSIEFPGKLQKLEDIQSNNNDSLSTFAENGKEIIEEILCQAPNVLADITFETNHINEKIENTKDLIYSNSKKIYSFSINIKETLENDFFDIFTAVVDDKLPNWATVSNELVNFYKLSKKSAKIKNGSFPIIFTSKAAKELLDIVELALNGKQVVQESSPWHNLLGKQVLSKLLTIKQDPSYGYLARAVDDEGCIIKPLTLINNGVLENFYFDLVTASRDRSRPIPTGNGFKPSLTSQPEPALLNMITSIGSRSLNQIIKDINYGLLIDQTMGGLTTNISGDMSVNVDIGFLIEKGRIVGRVKDTMVTGNIYTALSNILELSNDLKQQWSHIYNPDMLIDGLTITS